MILPEIERGYRKLERCRGNDCCLVVVLLCLCSQLSSGFSRAGRTTTSLPQPATSCSTATCRLPSATSATPVALTQGDRPDLVQKGSATWHWKNGWLVHYVQQGDSGPPLLLLPGFGVGTFHFDRNIPELAKTHRVFAVDLLGQGRSWPEVHPEPEMALCYSVDTWRDQIYSFIVDVIKEPAYIAGNSLGGYLGLSVAAMHKEWCKGLVLLNATPFWAFQDPANPMLWDGTLPAPEPLFKLGAFYFDRMRDPRTVGTMLKAVYADPTAVDDRLVDDIIAATNRGHEMAGHHAFTSILFAPKGAMSFKAMLEKVECPLALVYGREDPWVMPFWGQRIKRQRPDATYYEVSPSGHCPHHETPTAVNEVLRGWVRAVEEQAEVPLKQAWTMEFQEPATGQLARVSLLEGKPRSALEHIDHALWALAMRWRQLFQSVSAASQTQDSVTNL